MARSILTATSPSSWCGQLRRLRCLRATPRFGDKEQADQTAVDAMRPVLGSVRMNGVVVIGEG
jgi:hypothetical protein